MKEKFWLEALEKKVNDASTTLTHLVKRTPLMHSVALSAQSGHRVYLKSESLQHTGAFKVRGALYKMLTMSIKELNRGVVCASAGNHAQGVAYAAKMLGVDATIVMPENTPTIKVVATEVLGARVILRGKTYDEAHSFAKDLMVSEDLVEIHAFDDIDIMAGQGTIGNEVLNQLPECDVLLVPVGGGGLLAGVLAAVKQRRPDIRVIGVEPLGAAAMHASYKAGHAVHLNEVETRAEGVAVNKPGHYPFEVVSRYVDDFILVSEEEIEQAVWQLLQGEKLVVEYAGALSVAALKHVKGKEKNVVCLITGGNIDGNRIANTIANCEKRPLSSGPRLTPGSPYVEDCPSDDWSGEEVYGRYHGGLMDESFALGHTGGFL